MSGLELTKLCFLRILMLGYMIHTTAHALTQSRGRGRHRVFQEVEDTADTVLPVPQAGDQILLESSHIVSLDEHGQDNLYSGLPADTNRAQNNETR